MAFIDWNDSYNTYIPAMDQQHQGLVRLINQLHESIEAGHDREAVGGVIRSLVDYTIFHFREEESLMRQFAPSMHEHHSAFHAAFAEWISDQLVKWGMGEEVEAGYLLEYLRWWLLDHIACEDVAMARAILKAPARVAVAP